MNENELVKKAAEKCYLCIHKDQEDGEDYCNCWEEFIAHINWDAKVDDLEDGLCPEFQEER